MIVADSSGQADEDCTQARGFKGFGKGLVVSGPQDCSNML